MSQQQAYRRRPCKQDLGARGWVQGVELLTSGDQVVGRYFGGLRYAQPPTGGRRFRRPRPLSADFRYGDEDQAGPFSTTSGVCPQPGWPGILERVPAEQSDEDCLQVNVWVPAGEPSPGGGWPVFFYIHGGFLQFGNANKDVDVVATLAEETLFKAILVMPAYRLGVFGFLASHELQQEAAQDGNGETCGNLGFWDLRAALEWTAAVTPSLKGDAGRITIGGYSAGAHSAFHLLSHDLYLPPDKQLVRQVIMWSNGSGVQPKDLDEHQTAFDELLSKLKDVPLPQLDDGSASGKIQRLRQVPSGTLIDVVEKIDHSQFRGFSDGDFIHKDLIRNINSGDYGRRMKRRNIRLLIGECRDENFLYRAWKTPPEDSWESLRARLLEDYPVATVDKVLELYAPGRCLPARKDGIDCWSVLFGKIYADLQVHCLERGFINALSKDDGGGGGGGGMMVVGEDILRYRVEWRARCTDAAWPREWRVTHGTDDGIWWWGNGWPPGLTAAEKQTAKPLNDAFARFVAGERLVEWERKKGPRWVWRLSDRGVMDHWEDSRWDEAQVVWNVVNGTSSSPEARL